MRLGSMTLSLHPFSAARWITSQPTSPSPSIFGSGQSNGPTSGGTITNDHPEPQSKAATTPAAQNATDTSLALGIITSNSNSNSNNRSGVVNYTVPFPSADAEVIAANVHEVLESMRHRHIQLMRFFQAFNEYKANPLGGAMCSDMEEKIHQLALLIRRQQNQVLALMCLVEGVDEKDMYVPKYSLDGEVEQPVVDTTPPATNWLATIRMTVLNEVIDFTVNDLKRIEQSELLTKYPAKKKSPPSRSMSFSSRYSNSSCSSIM
ncbi:hypothetical protein EV175_004114 [Coemansia sp. RSA 1933]|nr:hypothetical protein EV175_004114 [Coemansia sp. RSA 1933]